MAISTTAANFFAGSASFLPAAATTTNYSSHATRHRLVLMTSSSSTPGRRRATTAGINTSSIISSHSRYTPLSSSPAAAAAAVRGSRKGSLTLVCASDNAAAGGGGGGGGSVSGGGVGKKGGSSSSAAVPNSNYVVPLDKAVSGITRPLGEILRDLNKRVPESIIKHDDNSIPWYHVNRMLSFYAPGWCGEIRNIIYSNKGTVTVVYRVTVRGSDGEAYRESTGTVSCTDGLIEDHVAAAEEIAFCRACARFGFGLYLYHEGEML